MKELIAAMTEKFGNQRKAAEQLGVTDRAFRNYVKNPDRIPKPMQKLMKTLMHDECDLPLSPTAPAIPHESAQAAHP